MELKRASFAQRAPFLRSEVLSTHSSSGAAVAAVAEEALVAVRNSNHVLEEEMAESRGGPLGRGGKVTASQGEVPSGGTNDGDDYPPALSTSILPSLKRDPEGGGAGGSGFSPSRDYECKGLSPAEPEPPAYLKAAAEALMREEGGQLSAGVGHLAPRAANVAASASPSPPSFIRIEPVLVPEPVRVFEGHSEDVLDVAWSRGDMLLSSSVDG